MTSNPRYANGTARRKVRATVLREESDCWLCGLPVDKTLPPHQDGSPEVDEVIAVSDGGDPLDRNNCRLSHRKCNHARGQKQRVKLKQQRTLPAFTSPRSW